MGAEIGLPGRLIAATTLLLALLALGAARADAAVYWGSEDGLGAANLDGSAPQPNYFYFPFAAEMQGPACGVALAAGSVYWAAPAAIVRRQFEGENLYPAAVVPHLSGVCGLATDGSHLFWGTYGHPPSAPGQGSIGRANLDGSEANGAFIAGLERPCGLATDGGHLYWIERGYFAGSGTSIGRANLDGSAAEPGFLGLGAGVTGCGIAASGGYLYWAERDSIARLDLALGEPEPEFIPNLGTVEGIAVQGGQIYWVSDHSGSGTSDVGRADLDGSGVEPAWIPVAERELGGVAVDQQPTPPALTLPARGIVPAPKLEFNVRSGAALLGVYVPPTGPLKFPAAPQGSLAVTSPGLSWTVLPVGGPYDLHAGDYLWNVRIRSGSGKVGKRIRTQLRERGWAQVNVHLAYTAPRSYPVESTLKVTLRRYPGAAGGWTKHPRKPKPKTGAGGR
jgi:virginiamycin B lyase